MPYDLRFEPWLPWRRRSGAISWGPPAQVTDGIAGNDPIVALACPRPDFNGAVTEFLIGLFSVALAPRNEAAWRQLWETPPSPSEIEAALRKLPDAFFLDGDGARAFQDYDSLEEDELREVSSLLINAPGENAARNNTDIFVKRAEAHAFGRPAAAMAVITLQTYAPSGGQGHRTSMRGGGPLTTLVEPRRSGDEPYWRLLWANSETADQIYERDLDHARAWAPQDRYPWLGPTRTSNTKQRGVVTGPADCEPAQAYFALPRRIRLKFETKAIVCALTGRPDEVAVSNLCTRNYGTDYDFWRHPLSPYYLSGEQWLPVHPQPGGIGWKDWLGIVAKRSDEGRTPAAVVTHFAERRASSVASSGRRGVDTWKSNELNRLSRTATTHGAI